MPSPELDRTEQQILDTLVTIAADALREQWPDRDPRWTKAVKRRVGEVGARQGLWICATGFKEPIGQGEWLYDLVWFENSAEEPIVRAGLIERLPPIMRVRLVLEVEWESEIRALFEDFMKLLVARADHRVMIFHQDTPEKRERMFGELERHICAFQQSSPGDRYLLVGRTSRSFAQRLVLT